MTRKLINFSIRFLTAIILCFISIGFVLAQAGTGGITGIVSDSTGAVVPNAPVKAVNIATGAELNATASEDGIYKFTLLQPGKYAVSVKAGSFAEQKLEVEVQVGRTTDANFTLGAANVSAVVEVTAEGIQTTQSNSDAVLNETSIQNLPINGRRFQDFITLTPGAQVGQGTESRGQVSLSGQRGINSNINVDGVDYNQPFFGGIRGGERSNLAFTIPQESIKEFQVVAAGYTAEFGRSSGGIVNAVTKSGTNELRGSLFYLYRPEQLSRGNAFTQALNDQKLAAAGVDPTLAPTQHQYGGSIGGPIVKNKFFYFGSFEQQKFSAPRQIIFAFPSGFPTGTTLTADQQAVYNFYNTNQTGYTLTNDAYAGLAKIDWTITENNRFNTRYNFSKNTAQNAVSRGETSVDPTTNQSISTNGTEGDKNNIVVSQLISNLSPTLINDFHFQYAREKRPRLSNSQLPQISNGLGVFGATAFLPTTQFDTRYQVADAVSYLKGNHTIKFGGEYSRLFADQTFGQGQFGQFTASTTAPTNAATTLTILNNLVNTPSGTFLGRFDNTGYTYLKQIGNLAATIKVQELAFFAQDAWRVTPRLTLNYGIRVEQQYNPTPDANNTTAVNAVKNTIFPLLGKGYDPSVIPDSGWQVGPQFGFAYDPKGDSKTVIRGYSGLYYARTPLIGLAASVNNFRTPPGDVRTTLPFNGFSQTTFNTFAASAAGANYRAITGCDPAIVPTPAACIPNTVFRQFAIAGVNLNTAPLNNLPILSTDQISSIASALGLSPNPLVGAQVIGHAPDFKNPVSLVFGLGVEHELSRGLVVGLDYSQLKTTRLQRNREINLPAPLTAEQYISFLQANNTSANFATMSSPGGIIDQIRQGGRTYYATSTPAGFINPATGASLAFPTGSVVTRLRPTQAQGNLALGSVQLRESSAKSFYRALTFRVRFVRTWGQLNAYYTLSRSDSDDDNERDSGGVGYVDNFDLSGEYYLSRLDRRHQFTANPVFFLPYGFEVSSAIRLRSGTPINATIGADANGDGQNNDRPLRVPGLTFKRNSFRNRAIYDTDLRIQKGFNFNERQRLIFSAEFFNIFNVPNLLLPSPNTSTSSGAPGQYCTVASQLCGLSGITNVNFLQVRDQNPASANFGKILISTTASGSPVFQMQLGARFQF